MVGGTCGPRPDAAGTPGPSEARRVGAGAGGPAASGVVAASTTARSTSTASRSRAWSASPSWSRTGRRVSARERRAVASTSATAGVMVISVAGASCGSGARRAQPFSSRRRTCPVIVGWLVWSAWARSPMRAGPSSLICASSRTCAGGASRRACRVAQRFNRATRPSSSSPRGWVALTPRFYIDNLYVSNRGPGRRTGRDVVSCGGDQRPHGPTMLLNLRLYVPPSLVAPVQDLLGSDPRVAGLAVLPGASRVPPGDVVLVDVPREAASEILD